MNRQVLQIPTRDNNGRRGKVSNPKNSGVPGHTKGLGAPLLAYILNIDDEQAALYLKHGGPLTSQQQTTLNHMERVLNNVKQKRAQNMVLQWGDTETLSDFSDPSGRSIFNCLRMLNGGDLSHVVYDDPVMNALSDMCVECFPSTLLPRAHDDPSFGRIALRRFFGKKQLKDFLSAVRMDDDLMSLFPDGIDDELVTSRRFFTSFGSGGCVQACLLHENILRSAVALMHSRTESSISAFQAAACEMLDILRAAVSGRPTKLPVFQIFGLIELPEDCEIPFKDSVLLRSPKLFLKHIPHTAHPATNSKNKAVAGCMLKMDCDFNVQFVPSDTEPDFTDGWPLEISSDKIKGLCEDVILGIALAANGDLNSSARSGSNIRIDPLTGIQQSWTSRGTDPCNQSPPFDSSECERLEKYLKLLSRQNMEPLKMAKTRLISAVIDRPLHDAGVQDSLVDAVIGLENLFGGRGEISFSLATGVSKLLGLSLDERNDIFAEAKKVYKARSKVVHGNSTQMNVSSERASAVSLLRRSLVELLTAKPELIGLKPQDRVKKLALA